LKIALKSLPDELPLSKLLAVGSAFVFFHYLYSNGYAPPALAPSVDKPSLEISEVIESKNLLTVQSV
jgi:hypothetical protein